MTKFRLVFFGTDDFSAPSLRALLRQDFCEIVAVVTKSDAVKSRGRKIASPLVAGIAREFNAQNPARKIAIFQPTKLREIEDDLRALKPDAGVLVAYGKIIPQSTIDLFAHGIINFHPSLLPKLRGPSPIETAILDGETETGLTLMKLAKEMDAGAIFYQEKISLRGDETAPELREKFSRRGAELLCEKLPPILRGEIRATAQNDADATYCPLIAKTDGDLNPRAMTAAECARKVRAYLGYPKTRLNFAKFSPAKTAPFPDADIIVTRAKVLPNFAGDAWSDVVPCADDTFLQIEKIVSPKSGREMSVTEWLRGIK